MTDKRGFEDGVKWGRMRILVDLEKGFESGRYGLAPK